MIRRLIDSAANGYNVPEHEKRIMITVIAIVWVAVLLYSLPTIIEGLKAIPTYNEVTSEIRNRPSDYYSRSGSGSGMAGFVSYGEFECQGLGYGIDQQACVKERIEKEFFGPIFKIAIPLLLLATLGVWGILKTFFWIQSSNNNPGVS